jgi:hypothetical protein
VPSKEILSNYIPFGIGRDLIIDIPIDTRRTVDIYIDDFIGLTVNVKNSDNMAQLKQAPLLGLAAISHKISPLEPLPCNNMHTRAKLKAKTGLTETKVILG